MAQQKKYNQSNKNRNYDNRNRNRNDNRRNQDNRSRDKSNRDNRNQNNQKANQQDSAKQGGAPKPQAQSKTESSNDLIIFIIFLISLAALGLANKFYFTSDQNTLYGSSTNLKFMKEGKLNFLDAQTGKAIVGVDIEVAKSSYEIEKGMMHRRSLPANAGMLFVFEEENYRTFWMKNTYLALDIIFVNADKEIIRIRKNAEPLSELSIPSGGKAKYVVEVLAGFTDAYQLHIGDHIDFSY